MTRPARCRNVYTVWAVLLLLCGALITALAAYTSLLVTSLPPRDTAYWSGAPALLAGIIGIYFSAVQVDVYTGNFNAFCIRSMCFVLNVVCAGLCGVASIFPAYHASVVAHLESCHLGPTPPPPPAPPPQQQPPTTDTSTAHTCTCVRMESGQLPRWYYYEIGDCSIIQTQLYFFLIALCVLNILASVASFAFVFCLWRSRYSNFYSGLRFFSYSAKPSRHPWSNPLPYLSVSDIATSDTGAEQPSQAGTHTPTTPATEAK